MQAVKVPWPGAREKDTIAPKYSWCRMSICVLSQYLTHTKVWSLCTFRRHRCYPPSILPYTVYVYIGLQAVKVLWPGARKKDTVAPKYSWFASAPAALASAPAALGHIWQLKTMAWHWHCDAQWYDISDIKYALFENRFPDGRLCILKT